MRVQYRACDIPGGETRDIVHPPSDEIGSKHDLIGLFLIGRRRSARRFHLAGQFKMRARLVVNGKHLETCRGEQINKRIPRLDMAA